MGGILRTIGSPAEREVTLQQQVTSSGRARDKMQANYVQFPRSLDEGLADTEQSYRWLKFGDIKGQRESVIKAAQDQETSTNYFKKNILKYEIES
jgi:hypothetical protein